MTSLGLKMTLEEIDLMNSPGLHFDVTLQDTIRTYCTELEDLKLKDLSQ